MQLTIELRPHIGKMNTAIGVIDVEHDQWMVYGKTPEIEKAIFLGYIGKREGSPFNGYTTYRDLPQCAKDAVVEQVAKLTGWTPSAYEPSTSPITDSSSGEMYEAEEEDE